MFLGLLKTYCTFDTEFKTEIVDLKTVETLQPFKIVHGCRLLLLLQRRKIPLLVLDGAIDNPYEQRRTRTKGVYPYQEVVSFKCKVEIRLKIS